MSSSGANGGGLNPNETVSSPVSLSVPCENVGTDEKLDDLNNSTFEDQNLIEETIMRTNQASLDSDTKIYLAGIQEENQQLYEEVLKQTKKNNAALAKQSELYDKLILGASKSTGADFKRPKSPDINVKLGGKRLLGEEETSEARSKKIQKLNSEEDQSSEDKKD